MTPILICGSRTWSNVQEIRDQLLRLKEEHGLSLFVVTGDAEGADDITARICHEEGIDYAIFPANWKGRGKPAGPIRNAIMFEMAQPHRVIAFHPFLQNSKGSKHMVEFAHKRDCPVTVVRGIVR